jgi:FkbM family methyltransferase
MENLIQNQDFFAFIASNSNILSRRSDWWKKYSDLFFIEIQSLHSSTKSSLALGEIGSIEFPYVSFGSINTTHLFGLDELILFSWYFINKNKYVKVLDLGANVGLHSLIMSKLGFSVDTYEPDSKHFGLLERVISLNPTKVKVLAHQRAVSKTDGKMKFTRVLGNTTSSHLSGAKSAPYGELEEIEVEVEGIDSILKKKFDFVKMDVGGHEAVLLSSISRENILETEFMVEIGTSQNAKLVYVEIKRLGLNAFSQKNNWALVRSVDDLPTSCHEGTLFLTTKPQMDWALG